MLVIKRVPLYITAKDTHAYITFKDGTRCRVCAPHATSCTVTQSCEQDARVVSTSEVITRHHAVTSIELTLSMSCGGYIRFDFSTSSQAIVQFHQVATSPF